MYAPNLLKKGIQNADAVVRKLTPASTKAINLRKKKDRKKQKVVDQQKTKAIVEKQWRDKKGSSLSIEDDEYYDSETFADQNQEDGFNPLGDD